MDVVSVDKRTLRFQLSKPEEDTIISDTLVVTNISPERIAFKVKTTNQSRYIVRPNVGTIPPDEVLRIFIGLQPSSDIPEAGNSKDKFLLRVAASAGTEDLSPDFWAMREESSSVIGLKFRVEFIGPYFTDDLSPPLVLNPFTIDSPRMQSPITNSMPPISPSVPTAIVPHVRDLPPDFLSAPGSVDGSAAGHAMASPSANISNTASYVNKLPTTTQEEHSTSTTASRHTQVEEEVRLENVNSLLSEGMYEEAIAKVAELQTLLDEKNLELTRLKTELAETRAETERVLKDAPFPPLAANKVLNDAFGGASITGFGLMLLLFLLAVNIVLRLV